MFTRDSSAYDAPDLTVLGTVTELTEGNDNDTPEQVGSTEPVK
jgi:hypothetical protein